MLNVPVKKKCFWTSGPDIIPLSQAQHSQLGAWLQNRNLNRGKIKCYQQISTPINLCITGFFLFPTPIYCFRDHRQ